MNAYELADELNRKLTGRLIGFTAIMLRQQADRIAELEKQSVFYKSQYEQITKTYQFYHQKYNELFKAQPKPMTAELKALLESVSGEYFLGQDKEEVLVEKIREQYSTPQTKLSDEEIEILWDKYLKVESVGFEETTLFGVHEFARAIEAKVRGES